MCARAFAHVGVDEGEEHKDQEKASHQLHVGLGLLPPLGLSAGERLGVLLVGNESEIEVRDGQCAGSFCLFAFVFA